MTGCGARSTFSLCGFAGTSSGNWQLSRDGNWHGSGMSHATTACPKPSFRAPWRVEDAVVGRGNARRTLSRDLSAKKVNFGAFSSYSRRSAEDCAAAAVTAGT